MDLIWLGVLGFAMGVITAICGGAGVFGVPTMLAFGIPPINTLALNRTTDLGVVLGALRNYMKSNSIDWRLGTIAAIPVCIGAFIGANIALRLKTENLEWLIFIGIIVGIFFLLKKVKPQVKQVNSKITPQGLVALLLCGMWSGTLGMAGATFAVLTLVYLFHKNYLQARSTQIVAALPETFISTAVLFFGSTVHIEQFVTMFITSFIGAWLGAHIAVKNGAQFIRYAMVAIAVVMIGKLIFFS